MRRHRQASPSASTLFAGVGAFRKSGWGVSGEEGGVL